MKTTYKIDPAHSSANFVVRHMMITNVRGGFSGVEGKIEFDPQNPTDARIEAVVNTAKINTLDENRDAHLRSADFLDAEQFPSMTFKSKKIQRAGDGEWKVTGDLTSMESRKKLF